MPKEVSFKAPWAKRLVWSTVLTSVLLIGVSAIVLTIDREHVFWAAVLPMGIFVGGALQSIRGYGITSKHIAVKRLIWSTYIGRHDLQQASVVDLESEGTRRIAGNGGLFAFTGLFRTDQLGRYHAFSTGQRHAVVLEFPKRKYVLTPEEPEKFVEALVPDVGDEPQ